MCNNQMLSPHFTVDELTASTTARKHGLDNTPTLEALENMRRLCGGTLEPLRLKLGLPVVITSCFRTKALNDLLAHSSERSQHMLGQAADFYVGWNGPEEDKPSRRELLIRAFREIITNPDIDFDQVILYPSFIHVSYVSKERNRHGILKAQGNGKLGYGRLSVSNALQIV